MRKLIAALSLALTVLLVAPAAAWADSGYASYYGYELAGNTTACGQVFDPEGLTAAHLSYPCGTVLNVTYPETGASVQVTVTDRGPYVGGRVLDLSLGAAQALGMEAAGVGYIEFHPVGSESYTAPPPEPVEDRSNAPAQHHKAEGVYTIKPGDTLSALSPVLGRSIDWLADHNNIEDPNLIYEGDVLHY
jgi:rare lipoprotein A